MSDSKLNSLLNYLEQDPNNTALLFDCANAAIEENQLDKACDLFTKLSSLEPLNDERSNIFAITLMRSGKLKQAEDIFKRIYAKNPDDTSIKFHLAWTASLFKDNETALEYLDTDVIDNLPQAAMLHLQIIHSSGNFEEATDLVQKYLTLHCDYPPLFAAISTLALDIEDEDLARECALKAGAIPEATTTLATLALGEQDNDTARMMFQKVLQTNKESPRAWIGLGLSSLANGDSQSAGLEIDKGAELFDTHLGSWIAAGWAYLISKDYSTARDRFEKAFENDPNFAETHGSLAVIDIIDGNIESAKNRIAVAVRLDRQCFSAAYAQMLIEKLDGNEDKAQRIMDIALNQPLNDQGKTIADAITRLATNK